MNEYKKQIFKKTKMCHEYMFEMDLSDVLFIIQFNISLSLINRSAYLSGKKSKRVNIVVMHGICFC